MISLEANHGYRLSRDQVQIEMPIFRRKVVVPNATDFLFVLRPYAQFQDGDDRLTKRETLRADHLSARSTFVSR
jgi:hypothetical protein